jgi:hypothetical protein
MNTLQKTEKLLSKMTRAEKAQQMKDRRKVQGASCTGNNGSLTTLTMTKDTLAWIKAQLLK